MTRPLAAVAAAGAMVAVAGCGDDEAATTERAASGPTEVRVSYVPATTVLPLHVAKQQGFFERQGLDVSLKEASNISDIPATLGRQFDIALGTATDLIKAGGAGVDVVQIAGNTIDTKDNPFVQLMVGRKSKIKSVADLEGKKVGTPTLGGVIHAAVQYSAKQANTDPAKIQGVEAPSPTLPDQLKAGRIDAVEALEPFATTMKQKGAVSLGDPFAAIGQPLATNFWIANGEWARDNTEVVDKYVAALEEAVAYIEANPKPARKVLQGYTGMPPKVSQIVPLPTYEFGIRADDLAKWVGVLREVGQFKGDVDPQKLVLADAS
ncbi:MAG: ABC transporter substrate-binding protein [Solirubrobacteraceae bacterium]|nr:ABC transporter substrate-binding protein [Solirubrobacteraceae bacterium]